MKEKVENRPTFIAANLLSRKNEHVAYPGKKEDIETRCLKRIELSKLLQKTDTNNKIWEYSEEFFSKFPQGKDAVWQLLKKWKITSEDKEFLSSPKDIDNSYPREFIDLDKETVMKLTNGNPENKILSLAEEARQNSLEQYDRLKSGLLNVGVPLLSKDYINELQRYFPQTPLLLIGLSADEILNYRKLNNKYYRFEKPPLLGVNKGYSPEIERMVKSNDVIEIKNNTEIDANDLDRGKIYITKSDVTKRLPVKPNKFKIGALYVWHHIPRESRIDFLTNLEEKAIKTQDNNIGLAIFEPHNNPNLLRMVLETNVYLGHETAAFDALIGTTACGSQTSESFLKEVNNLDCKINWESQTFPKLPPFNTFQRFVLPTQQVAIFGWQRKKF